MKPDIKIGLLLHFYQPWWQFPATLASIADECYRPIFRWLEKFPRFALSANINWSLIELLRANGHDDLLALMAGAVRRRQVELFGTAAHHPIMPLLNGMEMGRQIAHDAFRKNEAGFPAATCGGFYLPEYAFGREVIGPLKEAGWQFTVADDALYAARHGRVPFETVPRVDGLGVFLRSRLWGNALSQGKYDFDRFAAEFVPQIGDWFAGHGGYVILATDAETFGHHHKNGFEHLLKPLVERWTVAGTEADIVPFDWLWNRFPTDRAAADVPPGSWSTEHSDAVALNHFPLWNSPDNVYHQTLWRLINLARPLGAKAEVYDDTLKALSSCSWWQVCGRPSFSPGLMMKGADKALEVVNRVGDDATRREAHGLYETLLRLPGVRR